MADKNHKPLILIVDDSRVMRHAMVKILSENYASLEAENGEDAWTLLNHHTDIQVVFTDLSMPYLDGYGLLERIRNSDNENIATLPVVIITGKEDDDEAKMEALDKGANDFIAKPFDKIQLAARAQSFVSFKQTSSKLSETAVKLERQAAVDELTGLGSQRYFKKAADEILAHNIRHHGYFCVLRIDIDNFNALFIKYGKQAADETIKVLGGCLSKHVRKEDMAARVGLAKFALFLNQASFNKAQQFARRIVKEIPCLEISPDLKFTASVGVWEPALNENTTIDEVLEAVEKCLQQAINNGGDQMVANSALNDYIDLSEISIHHAIELIEAGKQDMVKPHLEKLRAKLKPLLKLFEDK